MGRYFDELKRSMERLAEDERVLFLGQATGTAGTFMSGTLEGVPLEKRIEMPVAESFQMQFSLGLALHGYVPVTIYPRQNFLLLAASDLVGMLDKLPAMSEGRVEPRLIIRVAAGTTRPLNPGHQHVGNYANAFRELFTSIEVVELHEPEDIFPAYERALSARGATMLIEFGDAVVSA